MRKTPSPEGFTDAHRRLGIAAAWAVFCLGVVYAITLVLGLHSLSSPEDPIGDPFFSLLELLIVFMAPLMVVGMVAVHGYAAPDARAYSLTALAFLVIFAAITYSVHFVILTVGHGVNTTELPEASRMLTFRWPSLVYALDTLSWDLFFALGILFAAPVFRQGRREAAVRILLTASGVLSLAGLIGVPLANMQIRMIGVIGYAGIAPIAFLLMAMVFGRTARKQETQ